MWIGACTSTIGTWMQTVAQQWLVYTLSKDDPFFLGLDGFLGQIPIVLFSLLGGVMADRTDRRKMLLGSQYVQMTTALVLAALTFAHVEGSAPMISSCPSSWAPRKASAGPRIRL